MLLWGLGRLLDLTESRATLPDLQVIDPLLARLKASFDLLSPQEVGRGHLHGHSCRRGSALPSLAPGPGPLPSSSPAFHTPQVSGLATSLTLLLYHDSELQQLVCGSIQRMGIGAFTVSEQVI